MQSTIAIVGMACIYPDAPSTQALWETVMARRRAFRAMPSERLNSSDYFSTDRDAPDQSYVAEVAMLTNYEFDRVHFRISRSSFRAADMTHWLALDVAERALNDAGFRDRVQVPLDTTGVIVGNTLTGEFSRANLMRLRWPYVRRTLLAQLDELGWSSADRATFVTRLEASYKAPFAPITEETLAGGLSNTIAGRICNHFDFKGGGYTVDGACASSLLAVTTACSSLVAGDLDLALAGGIDLSLDPFEIVGFAKAGALTSDEMRVYDRRSSGFWPGEGCGFVVLMRHQDAIDQQCRIYALIRGWGISSDGNGGLTRPEVNGQRLALQRAYQRAGFGIDTVTYLEGHGTGTSIGDATELRALSQARGAANDRLPVAWLGSIKANIGHTKAAAGLAGLIKATLALHTQVIPPATGCELPHADLLQESSSLQISTGMLWPTDRPLRSAVSAMGFGGINTHVVLEGAASERRPSLTARERMLLASAQDAELFLLSAATVTDLAQVIDRLLTFCTRLSRAELTDLAVHLAATAGDGTMRAAIVASCPRELQERLFVLQALLKQGTTSSLSPKNGLFLGSAEKRLRIGFVFPGQGSPFDRTGGVWPQRFTALDDLYPLDYTKTSGSDLDTANVQPALVTASLAGLQLLNWLNIEASVAVGHSLGELVCLHWAGALDEKQLIEIAAVRGRAMSASGGPFGAMVSIGADSQTVTRLLNGRNGNSQNGHCLVIAAYNSPKQTVISGQVDAVMAVAECAQASNLRAARLPVSHAFHSPLVKAAVPVLADFVAGQSFHPLRRTIFSTVTASPLAADEDLRALLGRQITEPVRFSEALCSASAHVDLWLEVGPGDVMARLVAENVETPVIALDAARHSLRGLLSAAGAAYAMGVPVAHMRLFADRFARPFDWEWSPSFLTNPCELAPAMEVTRPQDESVKQRNFTPPSSPVPETKPEGTPESLLELVRRLVVARTELPIAAIPDQAHLLSDLHLNSITVSQLVAEAARSSGRCPPALLTEYADATISQIATAIAELAPLEQASAEGQMRLLPGVDHWVRPFVVQLQEQALPLGLARPGAGTWQIIAPPEHPLGEPLQHALEQIAGNGVVVCLPPEDDERHLTFLLDGAHMALTAPNPAAFVLIQQGGGAAAFARTFHLEAAQTTTCVVSVPSDLPQAVELVAAEIVAANGYVEAHYDRAGCRFVPRMRLCPLKAEATRLPLGVEDVLLVTGGGKGITAECALTLAQHTGAKLGILGRSQPTVDDELAANLARLAAAHIPYHYVAADVTDAKAVQRAVAEIETVLGPITGILHGAARNVPQRLASLDPATFQQTLAPKVQGLRNVLAALAPERLRLLLSFGSIIARSGLWGQADYGLANQWLAHLTEQFAEAHPACFALTIEWSVWSDVGMGARLGRLDALKQAGVTPIPTKEGIALMHSLLAQPHSPGTVVVMGRFGALPTLKLAQPELPFMRFLEQPGIYYPGIELVVDVELSTASDPYLADHVFSGEPIFPAVMTLEAMVQVARSLIDTDTLPIFRDVRWNRPISVAGHTPVTIRIAALVREPNTVEVVLRSAETAFQVDHCSAILHFAEQTSAPLESLYRQSDWRATCAVLPLQPQRDLYGNLLFHRGRFQRLHTYRHLTATECIAEIAPSTGNLPWFGTYLPSPLLLGDPAVRDTAIHAIQACIPHATVLPMRVDKIITQPLLASTTWFTRAIERERRETSFVYDLEMVDEEGKIGEQWLGLHLQLIEHTPRLHPWPTPLLRAYVERRLYDLFSKVSVNAVVEHDPSATRQTRRDRALASALGQAVCVRHRADGKPEINGMQDLSVAHVHDCTLVVTGPAPLGCDLEAVTERSSSTWLDLLGADRFTLAQLIGHEGREQEIIAATRVWAASECLKKAGAAASRQLMLSSITPDGWILLKSGLFQIATLSLQVCDIDEMLVLAVLVRDSHARL